MVQVLERQPDNWERLASGLTGAIGGIGNAASAWKNAMNMRDERQALAKEFGEIFGKVRDPRTRELLLQSQQQKIKRQEELDLEKKDYDFIKSKYGPEMADFWKAATTGGRTKIYDALINQSLRGLSPQDILDGQSFNPEDEANEFNDAFEASPQEEIMPPTKRFGSKVDKSGYPVYRLPSKGRTPSEQNKFKSDLRKTNNPIYEAAVLKDRSLDEEIHAVDDLEKLSPYLPKGIGRIMIDPKTGNIRPWAQILQLVPPEAELYTKIINDFTTRAKDSYGARVTNFDLSQFMKRLPTASNSERGRELIFKRMKGVAEAEKLYHRQLKEIYHHYGHDGIAPEDARALAEKRTSAESERIRREAVQIDAELQSLPDEEEENVKSRPSLEEIFNG